MKICPRAELAVRGGISTHEVFERGVTVDCFCKSASKLHLAAASVKGARIGQRAQTNFASKLEGMISMQHGDVLDELVDVVGTVKFGEAGAASYAAAESLYRDVGHPAIGFRIVVRSAESKREAIIRLSIRLVRAVRSIELLGEVIRPETEGIDHRRIRDVIPLRPKKQRIGLHVRPPVGLDDGRAVGHQSGVMANEHLAVDGVLVAQVEIGLGQSVVRVEVGVKVSGKAAWRKAP